ncbi:hypothetical protein U9R90_05400 [Streptomyces sp. E11-3]|uniref:hypothetical protein n=1 Tax=Streptomyces sp. E11-3 TaxID=3110112 RepID=UPI003980BF38
MKLDDRFPSHRKIALLTDRAFRLHVSALCWCAENLTDGRISDRELTLVAHIRGLKATAKQLEDAGVWDRNDGGWVIHDFLDYNPSREQVLAERKKNAERQEKFRQRRNGKPVPPDGSPAPSRNGVTNGATRTAETHDGDTNAARRRHDGDTTATGNRHESQTEPQVNAFRNGVTNGAPSRPDPTPTPSSGSGRERSAGSDAREQEPALSLINVDWQPTDADRAAAASDLRRLGTVNTAAATAKFVRHHQAHGTRAANFGPLWVSWVARERAEPQQGAFLVGLPGGNTTPTPPTFSQRMAELDAAAEADRRRDREGDTA